MKDKERFIEHYERCEKVRSRSIIVQWSIRFQKWCLNNYTYDDTELSPSYSFTLDFEDLDILYNKYKKQVEAQKVLDEQARIEKLKEKKLQIEKELENYV